MSEDSKVPDKASDPLELAARAAAPGASALLSAVSGGLRNSIKDATSDVFGALIGDRIKEWRVHNLLATAERTARKFESRGIKLSEARSLPNSELYALFEGMSKAEDPLLQDMWAGLLASAADPAATDGPSASLINLLSQLGPWDAVGLHVVALGRATWLRLSQELMEDLSMTLPEGLSAKEQQVHLDEVASRHKEAMTRLRAWLDGLTKGREDRVSEARDNLLRLGLISVDPEIPRRMDPDFDIDPPLVRTLGGRPDYRSGGEVERAFRRLSAVQESQRRRETAVELTASNSPLMTVDPRAVMTPFVLTRFGRRLALACGLFDGMAEASGQMSVGGGGLG